MKFHGTLQDLQSIMMQVTSWQKWSGTRDKFVCRVPNGAVLNWWPSTGTIHIQGPDDAVVELENVFKDLLLDPITRLSQNERKLRADTIEVEYKEIRSDERGAALTSLPLRLSKRT